MRTIGLLGGMSWESTAVYYRRLNEGTRDRLGGLHSASIVLYSMDFASVATLQRADRWSDAAELLAAAAKNLQAAGADLVGIPTNTMHHVADEVAAAIDVPLVHIIDVTAAECVARGFSTVGLLGTAYTMAEPFYRERLAAAGLEVLVPDQSERAMIHAVIFDELCLGVVDDVSRTRSLAVVERLAGRGVSAVVLGCTEIGLLLGGSEASVPLLDTTELHCDALLAAALR